MVITNAKRKHRVKLINFRREHGITTCQWYGRKLSTSPQQQQHHFICHKCWKKQQNFPRSLYKYIDE